LLLGALAVALYLGFAAFSIGKPLQLDEALPTAWNAGDIARHGFTALGREGASHEISHPLLYQHVLGLSFAAFGESAAAARGLGVAIFLVSLGLLVALARVLWPGPRGPLVGAVAALLYATNPLCLQQSLVADPEMTLVPVSILGLCLSLIARPPLSSRAALLGASAVFAASLWCKEFPPFFLLAAFVAGSTLGGGLARGVVSAAALAVLGTALFAITWWLYCLATGVAPLSFIEFSLLEKALAPDFYRERSLGAALEVYLGLTGRWALPGFHLFLAAAGIGYLRGRVRGERAPSPLDFLWSWVVVYGALTLVVFYGIPRYQGPVYAPASLLIADRVVAALEGARAGAGRRLIAVIAGCALLGAVLAWRAEDPMRLDGGPYLLVAVVVPLALALLLTLTLLRGAAWRTGGVAVLLGWLAAGGVHLHLEQTADHNTSASWGTYGERGLAECAAFLDEALGDATLVARKDVFFALTLHRGRRDLPFVPNTLFRGDIRAPERAVEIERLLDRDDVGFVVLDPESRPAAAEALLTGRRPAWHSVRRFGDFSVFSREDGRRPASPRASARPAEGRGHVRRRAGGSAPSRRRCRR
jgi:hypothetical protein